MTETALLSSEPPQTQPLGQVEYAGASLTESSFLKKKNIRFFQVTALVYYSFIIDTDPTP